MNRTSRSPGTRLGLAVLAAAMMAPYSPAIAEWRLAIRAVALVPGEAGLVQVLPAEAPARQASGRIVPQGAGAPAAGPADTAKAPASPRSASGRIVRAEPAAATPAPVVEAVIRPLAAAAPVEEAAPRPTVAGAAPAAFATVAAVDDHALDGLRGGFELPNGLQLSFGIERAVYINGTLSSLTSLNVVGLGSAGGPRTAAGGTLADGATVAVIQNGPNNVVTTTGVTSSTIATVIQNTLDNQRIQAITAINARVNSMAALRAIRLEQALRDIRSLQR